MIVIRKVGEKLSKIDGNRWLKSIWLCFIQLHDQKFMFKMITHRFVKTEE